MIVMVCSRSAHSLCRLKMKVSRLSPIARRPSSVDSMWGAATHGNIRRCEYTQIRARLYGAANTPKTIHHHETSKGRRAGTSLHAAHGHASTRSSSTSMVSHGRPTGSSIPSSKWSMSLYLRFLPLNAAQKGTRDGVTWGHAG